MNSPEVQKQVDQELAEARAADVSGTPTFFVGGKRLQNRSVDGFKAMIDAALAKG
jgi:protein-disulfide isomerase